MPHDRKTQEQLFINREWSWLAFNERVLMEAANLDNPVFERMKFLSIVSSNLDEFFMVRVAGLRDRCNAGDKQEDDAGWSPKQQLTHIMPRIQQMIRDQHRIFHEQVRVDLAQQGVRFVRYDELDSERADWADRYFQREVYPILTPMAVDANRPFPYIATRSLNIGVLLEKKGGKTDFATVQVPSGLPRAIQLPATNGESGCDLLMLEDLMMSGIHRLFVGRRVRCCAAYRITRSTDFPIDEDDDGSILVQVESSLKKQKWGAVIRLEVEHDMDEELLRVLRHALFATRDEVYPLHAPLNLTFLLKQIYGLPGFDPCRYPAFAAPIPPALDVPEGGLWDVIRTKDRVVHHPYDSFEPVVRFVQDAARDPNVLAIKQTLYRVSGHSPIMRALADAAEAGKQVTVLLEIKARFDEENNIQWGKRLERAGCHVIYGLKKLKTHAKITLVVRREEAGIRRYVHLATGNYNDITATMYTDAGMFTADPVLGEDAAEFFNMLTGFSDSPRLNKLVYAPQHLRDKLIALIRREAEHARAGQPAAITAKMNALLDGEIAEELYDASQAGVNIRLLVRGICCLRPGVPGHSDRITVHSIVGRFLEHTRIYHFANAGQDELYMASADWMTRNLDHRVELFFPVEDKECHARVLDILERSWRDNAKTWVSDSAGDYHRVQRGEDEPVCNAQEAFIQEALARH